MGFSAIPAPRRKVTAVEVTSSLDQVNEMLDAGWDLFSTEPYMPQEKDRTFEMVLGPTPKVVFVVVKYES